MAAWQVETPPALKPVDLLPTTDGFAPRPQQSADGERLVSFREERAELLRGQPARVVSNYTAGMADAWHDSPSSSGEDPERRPTDRGHQPIPPGPPDVQGDRAGNRNKPRPDGLADYAVTKKASPTLFEVAYTALGGQPRPHPRRGSYGSTTSTWRRPGAIRAILPVRVAGQAPVAFAKRKSSASRRVSRQPQRLTSASTWRGTRPSANPSGERGREVLRSLRATSAQELLRQPVG
jgi:hypothetical protein